MAQTNNTLFVEECILFISPEPINILVLTAALTQMYNGIEIGHPIFKILFCNLAVTLISSLLNVVIYAIVKNIRCSTLVNTNNAACLMFHCSAWCTVYYLCFITFTSIIVTGCIKSFQIQTKLEIWQLPVCFWLTSLSLVPTSLLLWWVDGLNRK